jgi:hypothetical protein
MEVQSNENAALLKLLKTKSRTKTELLKLGGARRRARQAALDALLAEGKVIRIDKEYFANDPSGLVDQLIDAEAARLDAYLRSVPELLSRSGKKLRRAMKDNALASVALQRLLETGQVIELNYKATEAFEINVKRVARILVACRLIHVENENCRLPLCFSQNRMQSRFESPAATTAIADEESPRLAIDRTPPRPNLGI